MTEKERILNLTKQIQAGSEIAFAQAYDMYSSALYGFILKIIRDEDSAQDILQDCFVDIWAKVKMFDASKGSFYTWMLNICRNKSIDVIRKQNREHKGKGDIYDNEYGFNETSINTSTIGVNDLVQKLDSEKQLIINLLYFKGYTQQEVSDKLEIPLGTVKTRARAAIKDLKHYFTLLVILWM